MPNKITFPVTYCSDYADKRQPNKHEYEETAWILTTSPSRKVGFMSPTERKAKGIED